MSVEKNREQAERWLLQAEADLRAALASRAAGSHEWCCFQCQQAGEKALKAIWLSEGHDPWGHSLLRLIRDHPEAARRGELEAFVEHARHLDKLYVPTRYPNGLPDLTPSEVYAEPDAAAALEAARALLEVAARLVRGEARPRGAR